MCDYKPYFIYLPDFFLRQTQRQSDDLSFSEKSPVRSCMKSRLAIALYGKTFWFTEINIEERVQGENLISSHGWGGVKLVGFTGVTSEA